MEPLVIRERFPLGMHWPTVDPFLFCAHHHDDFPAGDESLGPDASLRGRSPGQDFSAKDGWSMYHGSIVPGSPRHPHRGFETVTYLRAGHIDHADSMGATARFGPGDVQWMTAGAGIQHAEMMPLLNRVAPNPVHLFQIWLNLPAASKMATPAFRMLWAESIPEIAHIDAEGRTAIVRVVAGHLDGQHAPAPPPDSWAADPAHAVTILHVTMEAHGRWRLPAARSGLTRALYLFDGEAVVLNRGEGLGANEGALVVPDREIELTCGAGAAQLLLLQGQPIGEPVAQYGPFVMNEPHEVHEAFDDYRRTQFGGWPWRSPDPNHGPDAGRFAIDADGTRHEPGAT